MKKNKNLEVAAGNGSNPQTAVKKNKLWTEILKHKYIYLMFLPIAVYYIIFMYIPMAGNIIAFQNYKITRGIFASKFVGFHHFKNFLNDVYFWRLLRNTLTINVISLVVSFPMPIILALLLNEVRCKSFKKAVQTITYMPHFISVVIICGIIKNFVATDGVINSIIGMFGGDPVPFLTEPKYFPWVYVISGLWQEIGWSSIIYLSALSGIDQELYEAAAIDGANRWKQTIHITLPGLLPTISILLIMKIGSLISIGYEKILLLYNPAIYETADVISTYVYRQGILDANYSYSGAVSFFNSIISLILIFSSNAISKKVSGSGLF